MAKVKFNNFFEYFLDPVSFYMKSFDDTMEEMSIHYHPYIELMYVQSGSFTFLHYDEQSSTPITEYNVVAGQFVVLDCFTKHKIRFEKNQQAFIYNVEFNPRKDYNPFKVNEIIRCNFHELFNRTEFVKISQDKKGFSIINDTQNVGTTLKKLLLLIANGLNCTEDACSLVLREILLFNEIAKCLRTDNSGTAGYIRKAKKFILDNYQRPITVSEIAEHVGKSKSYLQRQYKTQVGETILDTLNKLRIERAASLIENTNIPIMQIAIDVGFSNKNHLNYEFKKIHGRSPLEYRKLHKNPHIDHHYEFYDSVAVKAGVKADVKSEVKTNTASDVKVDVKID